LCHMYSKQQASQQHLHQYCREPCEMVPV
jgi:hypothetical protein